MVTLTIIQRDYLRAVGWSPVSRTPTEWPSILALGPHGFIMCAGFLMTACSGLLLAASFATGRDRHSAVAVLLAVAGVGLIGVTFRADPPQAACCSWHANVHNTLYPLVPIGVIGAAIAAARSQRLQPWLVRLSRWLVPFMVVTIALTNVNAASQLARYFAFACLLAWVTCAGIERLQNASRTAGPAVTSRVRGARH